MKASMPPIGLPRNGTLMMLALAAVLWILVYEVAPAAYGNTPKRYPILAACTRFEYNIFEDVDFLDEERSINHPEVLTTSDISRWTERYHATVGGILAQEVGPSSPGCGGGSLTQASSAVRSLARKLPSWHPRTWDLPTEEELNDPDAADPGENVLNFNADGLTEAHVGVVLLEYLRMYECALVERSIFLPLEVLEQEEDRRKRAKEIQEEKQQEFDESAADIADLETQLAYETDPEEIQNIRARLSVLGYAQDLLSEVIESLTAFLKSPLDWGRLLQIYGAERKTIMEELTLSRRSLSRALTFTGIFSRLKAIDGNIQCIQQGTLDIRNGFALSADASSCLPRVWNIKDPLRDYK